MSREGVEHREAIARRAGQGEDEEEEAEAEAEADVARSPWPSRCLTYPSLALALPYVPRPWPSRCLWPAIPGPLVFGRALSLVLALPLA